MYAGLFVHSAWWQPRRMVSLCGRGNDYDGAVRALAWCGLDVRCMGALARRRPNRVPGVAKYDAPNARHSKLGYNDALCSRRLGAVPGGRYRHGYVRPWLAGRPSWDWREPARNPPACDGGSGVSFGA